MKEYNNLKNKALFWDFYLIELFISLGDFFTHNYYIPQFFLYILKGIV